MKVTNKSGELCEFWITGTTGVAIYGQGNSSNKTRLTLSVEEVKADGSLSAVGFTASIGNEDGSFDFVVHGSLLDPSKFYKVTVNANNSKESHVHQIRFLHSAEVTVSTYGWASYNSDYALDLTGKDFAYAVTGLNAGGTAVELSPVTEAVAANTPLLIKGTGTHLIPLAATGSDISGTNKLVAVTANNTEITKGNDNTLYVLSVQNEEAVFARINETAATLYKGQAYLQLSGQYARSLNIGFDDETTDIPDVREKMSEGRSEYYDLQGRRVAQPTKGLYIANGRKVVIK